MAPATASLVVASGSTLKSVHVWEVTSPLPININPSGIIRGHRHHRHQHRNHRHFLPANFGGIGHRRRRLNVEVHHHRRFESATATAATATVVGDNNSRLDGNGDEICYVRILEPNNGSSKVTEPIKKGTVNLLRKKGGGDNNYSNRNNNDDDNESDSDDGTLMTGFREPIVREATTTTTTEEEDGGTQQQQQQQQQQQCHGQLDGWKPKYKISLQSFHIVEAKKRSVIVSFDNNPRRGQKSAASYREFVFDDESELSEFCSVIEENRNLLDGCRRACLEAALRDIHLEEDEELTLLFDICSGSNLLPPRRRSDAGKEDSTCADPYVSVGFDGRKIHETDSVSSEADPIWTLRKGALFVWKVDALELFQSEEGLTFEVKDKGALKSDNSLGAFRVDPRTLYNWNGERREFALGRRLSSSSSSSGGTDDDDEDYENGGGSIALRVRRATEHDVEFMEKFDEERKGSDRIAFPHMPKAGTTFKSIMNVHSKKEKEGPDKGKTKYLIRPGPDPRRMEETSWLTKERIEEETMHQSNNWTDIGSGALGKIFVEVLGCDDLPNMDTSRTLGDKTDAFVSLVYEDCFARTDVIANCLSPRWLPWTRRAFIFNMRHTSSQLFLGVFDSDENSLSKHDLAGRVSIDLSNFQRDSIYELHYKLYPTAQYAREAHFGTIKIRLRLELEDERTLLLSNFNLPRSLSVNVGSKKDYQVIKKTVEGNLDTKSYSKTSILFFLEELLDDLTLYYYLKSSLISLILWRGRSTLALPLPSCSTRSIKWVDVEFPLHSLVAFICAVNLVENPDLVPSFCFLCIGWSLLAREEWRRESSNPWEHSKSFSQFLSALILGNSVIDPTIIEPSENKDGEENARDKHLREAERKAKKRVMKRAKEYAQFVMDMEVFGDINEDLYAEKSRLPTICGVPIDPKAYLLPTQQYLRLVCIWIRVAKNIFAWEECYISFWIAITSFILSVVVFFVPWGFLIKWVLRIIAWVALGPWMKLADKFYFSRLTENNQEGDDRRGKKVDDRKLGAQIARENTYKLRDFKQYMFGEHICKVNTLKKDRFHDIPLPSSSAAIYTPKSKSLGEVAMQEAGYHRNHVNGQQLAGEMIPKICGPPSTEAPTGKPTKKTDLFKEGSPATFYDVNDSYSAAAIKVGSIIVGAGAITWFGVPLFVYLVRLLLPE